MPSEHFEASALGSFHLLQFSFQTSVPGKARPEGGKPYPSMNANVKIMPSKHDKRSGVLINSFVSLGHKGYESDLISSGIGNSVFIGKTNS